MNLLTTRCDLEWMNALADVVWLRVGIASQRKLTLKSSILSSCCSEIERSIAAIDDHFDLTSSSDLSQN